MMANILFSNENVSNKHNYNSMWSSVLNVLFKYGDTNNQMHFPARAMIRNINAVKE